MQVRSLGQEDSLEKGMATHSSIRAWMRIPWTESLVAIACGVSKGQRRLDNSREQARRHAHRQQDGKRNVALVKSLWDAYLHPTTGV